MKYKPIITKKTIIFNLDRPFYFSLFVIWKKWLQIAKNKNLKIVVRTPFGVATFENVDEYLKGAEEFEMFYNNSKKPMIFYGRDLLSDIRKREGRIKLLEAYKKIKDKK